MRDLLFAADFAVWAITTAAPAASWWEEIRLWQIMVPAVTALIGFFAATRYNHHLTMKRAEAEKVQARKALASELHAELFRVGKAVRRSQRGLSAILDAPHPAPGLPGGVGYPAGDVKVGPTMWAALKAPRLIVTETHFGQLGLLPRDVAARSILLHGMSEDINSTISESVEYEAKHGSIPRVHIGAILDAFKEFHDRSKQANIDLSKIADTEPFDWAEHE